MRNIIFAINVTLDGCCDHTKQIADEETHEYFTQLLREVDLLVFGRKTYQLMVPFWPEVAKNQSMAKASNEFARTFDSIKKLFCHDPWTVLKIKIRESFARTFTTKYLN